MDTEAVRESSVSIDHVDSHNEREDLGKLEFSDGVSGNGEAIGDSGNSVEILTRIELDLACVSEKIINLFVLMMNVATMETDFEALTSDKERASDDGFFEKALEFDFLTGFLDSEVRDLDGFMSVLHSEISDARALVSSCSHEEGTSKEIEERLSASEQSFKISHDQISEIRGQSATLKRTLSSLSREGNWNGDKRLDEDQFTNPDANIKMGTPEQQRHILRMLEKSLAREIDLENKLTELRQVEEELKQRPIGSEREVYCFDDETSDVSGRWFEAENNAVVLKGISKELLGRLRVLQFSVDGSILRETELKNQENSLNEVLIDETNNLKASLREAEDKLILSNSEAFALLEKVSLLEKQLKESEFKLLNAEVSVVGGDSEKVESLEKRLRESDIELQCAVASDEASLEKQNMLYSAIDDMQQVIDDLKTKVTKQERMTDSAEEKCIALSELNAELNDELSFLRGRLESLEASLQQADESKMVAAKGIGIQNKVVKNLVLQLACERNRLHKQISSLATENKLLVQKLKENNNDKSSITNNCSTGNNEKCVPPKHSLVTDVMETSTASSKLVKTQEDVPLSETEVTPIPGPETVRRIDAGVFSFKYVFLAILVLPISIAAYYAFQLESCPF